MLRLVMILFVAVALPAHADPASTPAQRLDAELDRLESRVIQRQNRSPRTSALLTRQDLAIAERQLSTLKTRTPRHTGIPLLSRQFDRVRRQHR